jgi:hypothetical protein
MTHLSEDPTYLAGGFLLLAAGFLVALKVSQQGKYLIRAGVAVGLAVAVVVIEWLWVTDVERIQQVVYDLRQAVLECDAETALAHMSPTIQYSDGNRSLSADATRTLIRLNLSRTHFEFIRISELRTTVGRQSRRGTAEFRAFTRGAFSDSPGMSQAGTAVTAWSLGFEEAAPGSWKVNRITLLSSTPERSTLPAGLSLSSVPVSGR